jgi:hypothetical protein
VSGTLNGKSGSFLLQHRGTMSRGSNYRLEVTVVRSRGPGELGRHQRQTMAIIISRGKTPQLRPRRYPAGRRTLEQPVRSRCCPILSRRRSAFPAPTTRRSRFAPRNIHVGCSGVRAERNWPAYCPVHSSVAGHDSKSHRTNVPAPRFVRWPRRTNWREPTTSRRAALGTFRTPSMTVDQQKVNVENLDRGLRGSPRNKASKKRSSAALTLPFPANHYDIPVTQWVRVARVRATLNTRGLTAGPQEPTPTKWDQVHPGRSQLRQSGAPSSSTGRFSRLDPEGRVAEPLSLPPASQPAKRPRNQYAGLGVPKASDLPPDRIGG